MADLGKTGSAFFSYSSSDRFRSAFPGLRLLGRPDQHRPDLGRLNAPYELTAVNDKAIVILSKVIRTGATSQRAYGNIGGIDTADESDYSEPAETLSGAIDIDFWATTPSSSGDCTFQFATVEFLP